MINKKVLLLGTYPIKNAQHGGQKRIEALLGLYRTIFSDARYAAVFYKGFYKDYSPQDIPLSQSSEPTVQASPYTGDIICGDAVHEDPAVRKRFTSLLVSFQPDIIQIEQPFIYFGVERVLGELGLHPQIIYSSHNIEAPMKREILAGTGTPAQAIESVERRIAQIEERLSKNSALVIACTDKDAEAHRAMGAKRVVVAQNGIAPLGDYPEAAAYWHQYFSSRYITKTAVFVGSAHPPNWAGFLQMVGLGVGFMPFGSRILLAGSISDYFNANIADAEDMRHITFWQRVIACGRLPEDKLEALLGTVDVVILPITEGGGSNLKTAEALIADKPIVATSHAFRSYEQFKRFPNVYIADTPEEYRAAMVTALSTPPKKRSASQQEQVRAVLWDNRFKDVAKEVERL